MSPISKRELCAIHNSSLSRSCWETHLGVLVLLKLACSGVTSELGLQERGNYLGLWHLGAAGAQPALAACGAHNGGRNGGTLSAAGGSGAEFLFAQ